MKNEKINIYDIQLSINEFIKRILYETNISKLEQIILEIKSFIYEIDILKTECEKRLRIFNNNLYSIKHFSFLDST